MTEQVDAALVAAMRSETVDDTELRDSLKEGWVEELPAIQDENGVVLVGNRRLRLAAELGIQPVIKTITVGQGTAADAKRFRLAYASNIGGKPMTTAERKKLAIYLAQTRNWQQSRIGKALGVGQQIVSRYLNEAGVYDQVVNPLPPRPQGGRPPGRRRTRQDPRTAPEGTRAAAASAVLDHGQTQRQAARDRGLTEHAVRTAVIEEEARREVRTEEPQVTRDMLSLSAQEKLDAALRRYQRELDATFSARVQAEIVQRHEYLSAQDLETIRNADLVMSSNRGIMKPAQYRDLLRCLHPDTHANVTPDALNRSFELIHRLKGVLVQAEPNAALDRLMPRSAADLMRLREQVRQQRRAARARGGRGQSVQA